MSENTAPRRRWALNANELRTPLPAVELAGCAVLFLVFVLYLLQALALPQPLNAIDIGAGGFPVLLAVFALAAIGLVAVLVSVKLFGRAPVECVSIDRPGSIAIAIGLMLLQSIYFEELGAIESVIVFAVGMMLAGGERRILHLIGVPLALAAFVWAAFIFALSVNLP